MLRNRLRAEACRAYHVLMTTYTTQDDEYYSPIEIKSGGVRCGNHPADWKVRHENVDAVRACYAITEQMAAQQAAECYAEAVMSWVAGGGSPADAGRYAVVVARGDVWDGGVGDMVFSGKLCGHGLALELCEGPQHYPLDSSYDY